MKLSGKSSSLSQTKRPSAESSEFTQVWALSSWQILIKYELFFSGKMTLADDVDLEEYVMSKVPISRKFQLKSPPTDNLVNKTFSYNLLRTSSPVPTSRRSAPRLVSSLSESAGWRWDGSLTSCLNHWRLMSLVTLTSFNQTLSPYSFRWHRKTSRSQRRMCFTGSRREPQRDCTCRSLLCFCPLTRICGKS